MCENDAEEPLKLCFGQLQLYLKNYTAYFVECLSDFPLSVLTLSCVARWKHMIMCCLCRSVGILCAVGRRKAFV